MGEETKVSSLGIKLIVLSTSSTILTSICIVIYRESNRLILFRSSKDGIFRKIDTV